ncbi:hypothetical protein SCHPADRAFT_931543 [Schizopora paradoxa]|uniref:Uncharacterized protein n=1 Tax=Schizopora paradoxa TaxID=27342 RepID=A0A0H2RAI9_9AGAM|nr:hypothetical protein SCHPADRAFT_931543 [Schizopora paradoxa]
MPYNYHTQLARTDTHVSVSTNATAPNLPGPGRNLGLLLDGVGKRVESILNKCANRIGMGPVPVAQEIRILSRHNESTIYERYSMPPRRLSEKETKALKKRCNKLLKFTESKLLSTQLAAFNEVTELAIDDSLIRAIFADYYRLECLEPKFFEPDLLLTSAKALASIEEAETHKLWSTIILRSQSSYGSDFEDLAEVSLRNPNTSFIAVRHVLNAKKCVFLGHSLRYLLLLILMKVAFENWSNMELSTVSNCLCEFMRSQKSGHRGLRLFCNRMAGLNGGCRFARKRHEFAEFFPLFCPIPRVVAERNTVDSVMTVKEVTNWNLDNCAPFCVAFLTTLSGSADIYDQLLFIESIDAATRRLLEGTALLDELCIAYCHLRHFSGVKCYGEHLFIKISNPHSLPHAMKILTRGLCEFTISPIPGRDSRFDLLFFASILKTDVVSLSLNCGWTPVRSTSGLNFGEFGRRETSEEIYRWCPANNISIDVLLYDCYHLAYIGVGKADSFEATGHFPILAGYDESGRALFCAEGDRSVSWRWTSVLDRSSIAIFKDVFGEQRASQRFKVLGLRFDPSDIKEDSASDFEGAKDPTGPLHWRSVWPSEDPSLSYIMGEFGYNRMKEELIPFLDECARSTSYRADKQEEVESGIRMFKEDNMDTRTAESPLGQCGHKYEQVGASVIRGPGLKSYGEDCDALHEGGEVEERKLLGGTGNINESSIPDISSGALDDHGASSNCTREDRLDHGPNTDMSEERDNEENIEY